MNDLLELLTAGLTKLREDFNNLPNHQNELSSISSQLKQLQSEQLTKDTLKSTIDMLLNGYIATAKDEYLLMIDKLVEEIKANNTSLLTEEITKVSKTIDSLIANAVNQIKDDLNQFKQTIRNGKDGINGTNGKDGKNGLNGKDGVNGKDGIGKDGLNGLNGLGIKDIKLVRDDLVFTLDDNTTKTIPMPKAKSMLFSGGGLSIDMVQKLINDSLSSFEGGSIDAYMKTESDNKYIAQSDENLFIQDSEPNLPTGKQALWIDTSNGNISLNLVIGD